MSVAGLFRRYKRSRLFLLGTLCTFCASLMFAYNLRIRDESKFYKSPDVQIIDVSEFNALKSLKENAPKLSAGVPADSLQESEPNYPQNNVPPELTERNIPLFRGNNIQIYQGENDEVNAINVESNDVRENEAMNAQEDASDNDAAHEVENVQKRAKDSIIGIEEKIDDQAYRGDDFQELAGAEFHVEVIQVHDQDATFHEVDEEEEEEEDKEEGGSDVLCKFPELDPFDPAIRKFFPSFEAVKCHGTPVITKVEEGVLLFVDEITMSQLIGQSSPPHCRYRAILRHPESSILFQTSPWKEPLQPGHVFSEDEEIVHVECYDRTLALVAEAFHLIIQVKPDEEILRNERFVEHVRKDNPLEILNVVLVGVDSTSRMNYIRSLPKTRRLLSEMGGIEMEMYNKIADNTVPNLTGFFTGRYVHEQATRWNLSQPMDDWDFVWHRYRAAGYRSLFVEEFVTRPIDHIFHSVVHKGFARCPADFCNRPLSAYVMQARDRKERRDQDFCLGATPEIDVSLRCVRDFIAACDDTPHFVFNWLWKYGHQNPARMLASDEKYANFFKGLRDDHLLDQTMLVFFSDHGARYGEFRSTFNGMIEERAPFITLVFPKWFRARYPGIIATLKTNSRRLTTHFDMHETLLDVLHFSGASYGRGDVSQRGISLFNEIPKGRTCKDAQLASHWCLCKTMTSRGSSLSEEESNYIAQALLLNVNAIAKAHEEHCVRFTLSEIVSLVEQTVQKEKADGAKDENEDDEKTYMVTIKVTPGDAIFEATMVRGENNKALVKGRISRLTAYQGQADCVSDPYLKLYCYCRDKHQGKGDSVAVMEDLL